MSDVELIKAKIDIVSFVSDYVPLKKSGRTYKANCPFHSENTPSFFVSPERGTWHCFGACSEGGDAISFLQKWENIEFVEALKILAQKTGVTLSKFAPTESSKIKDKLYEINHLSSEFYHYILTKHRLGEKALSYFEKRGIRKETIRTFILGYAPDSWDSLSKFLVKKGYSLEDIFTAGLIIKKERGGYYDRFRGRIMFVLKDIRGNIIGFSGRKLNTESGKEAKYVNTPETPIYSKGNNLYGMEISKEEIKKQKEAVVVEGEFDLLGSFQSGVSNVVAIKGSALTEGQVLLLKRYTENIILALDSDFAGSEAARRGIEIADRAGLTVRVVKLLFGKDPAECVEKSPHLWQESVKKSMEIYDFVIETALEKYKKDDVSGKKKIGDEVAPFLAKITNPIIQSHYVKRLAGLLNVSEEALEMMIKSLKKSVIIEKPLDSLKATSMSREAMLEENLLALVIQYEKPQLTLAKVFAMLEMSDFQSSPVAKIFKILTGYLKSHSEFDVKKFGSLLSPEIVSTFDKAFLLDIENILNDHQKYTRELTLTLKSLKKNALRRRIADLSTKIGISEDEVKETKLDDYQQEIKTLLGKLQELD